LKGFASVGYSGPNNTPNTWANIYTNVVTLPGGFGVLGPCGALDQSLTAALGPDPLACSNQTGPLPSGSSSSTPSGGNAGASSGSGSSSGSTSTSAPNSGAGGLSQLLGPVLGGKGTG
jgi:hypothetical protein